MVAFLGTLPRRLAAAYGRAEPVDLTLSVVGNPDEGSRTLIVQFEGSVDLDEDASAIDRLYASFTPTERGLRTQVSFLSC